MLSRLALDGRPPAASTRAAGTFSLLLLLLAVAAPAAAQPELHNDEDLAFDRPEAWALKYFTSVSLMTGFGPPEARRPWSVDVAVELGWIPQIDDNERQVGFAGTKVEDLNKAPLFFRPRLSVGLPADVSLTFGYVPPVEVFDAKAEIYSLSLDRPLGTLGDWRFGGRLYGQVGSIESDVTCPDEVAGNPDLAVNPSQCEAPSRDEITLRYAGFELSTAWGDPERRVSPYAALAVNRVDGEFQVDALTGGLRDRSLLTTDGWTWSASAGARYRHPSGLELAVEAFYSPLEVDRDLDGSSSNDPLFNVRTLATWRLR